MSSQRIFFLHNPKAGGSSLQKIFRESLGAQSIAPVFSNAPNDHRENKSSMHQHRGYDFYAGHYGYDAFELLGDGHILVTNFRDPVARVVSIYRYWRNNITPAALGELQRTGNMHPRDVAVVRYAHELEFGDFIRSDDPDLLLYISNFHFRQLHHSPWEASEIRRWHVWRVKWRITQMPWFYVAEMPMLSMLLLGQAFPELVSIEIPNENLSLGDRIALSSADVEHLVRMNRFDYEIYHHAILEQYSRAN